MHLTHDEDDITVTTEEDIYEDVEEEGELEEEQI
jgi:hypothetical protein